MLSKHHLLELLHQRPWLTYSEIAAVLNAPIAQVRLAINQLARRGEIELRYNSRGVRQKDIDRMLRIDAWRKEGKSWTAIGRLECITGTASRAFFQHMPSRIRTGERE